MAPLKSHLLALSSLLLSTAIAAPVASEPNPCTPTSYTVDGYIYHFIAKKNIRTPTWSNVTFTFQPNFPDPSIIKDPASTGATCFAESDTGPIAPGNACSSGKDNLQFGYGYSEVSQWTGELVLSHSWECNGVKWSSNTWHTLDPLYGSGDFLPEGGIAGVEWADPATFAPGNVTHV